MKRPWRWLLRIAWIVGAVSAWPGAAQTLDCAQCHEQPHLIATGAHAKVGCLTCHRNHDQFPHPEGIPKPACGSCHTDVAAQNRLGIHGRARAAGNQAAPDCAVCHGDVHLVQSTGTEAFRKSIPGICGKCHNQVYAQYRQSVHGKAVAAGIVAAPVCSTCHGEHRIQPPAVSTSPVNPIHVPETCGRCHGDVALARKFDLPNDIVVSYEASFHGLALKAGQETVANCATCHGVHDILPAADPRSTINPKNLPRTCGKCHPGAGTRFAIGRMHWSGRTEPPAMRWVRLAYLTLIPFLIGLMALHNLGDWTRKLFRTRLWARPDGGRRNRIERVAVAAMRMLPFERVEHGLLVVSFSVLVWSGFALTYPNQWWATPLLAWESGWAVRGTVHRIAGVILMGLALTHVISLAARRDLRAHWKGLLPKLEDLREGLAAFAYNVGVRTQKPATSRHSYIEKIEYWAVLWGVMVMALTGVLLWAHTYILAWLPGIVLNVAGSIHFYEAVLATLAIVIWHLYRVIFDPDVYPVDPSWLTGYSVREYPAEETGEDSEEEA
ncbi:MAG TPA: cytochrome c3 family protein [Bryobacteraceae bacterium]|nr:cytochrome c3 family protein [Bryobacteraceae bacterium]